MSRLAEYLQANGAVRTPRLVEAFRAVDRADFLSRGQQRFALESRPLPIGYGQTNSQPSTVAFTLELLQPEPGDKILDVGSGSGWTTALLAQAVGDTGRVYGVEVIPELVEFGRRNVEQYNHLHIDIRMAGKMLGLPEKAPFDKILVSASAPETPHSLVEQLAVGGRMVASVQNSLVRVDKIHEDDVDIEEFPGFAFVPLRND